MMTRRRFSPARGGHAPEELRDMLYRWIEEQGMDSDIATTEDGVEWPVDRLLGLLWNCTDALPGEVRSYLDGCGIEAGSVAGAVRGIKARRR